jgi:hypothetical protein
MKKRSTLRSRTHKEEKESTTLAVVGGKEPYEPVEPYDEATGTDKPVIYIQSEKFVRRTIGLPPDGEVTAYFREGLSEGRMVEEVQELLKEND